MGPILGPILIPRLITWYRTQKTVVVTSPTPIQAIPTPIYRSFNILFFSAVIALLTTLPYFSPENIFTTTSSRLQTPNDVLFTRLALARTDNNQQLTENDLTLKPKLASLDSRCLYFTYGPSVLTHCPFCTSDEPMTYFYFALPTLLLPHILHLFALGAATSSLTAGKLGNRWRTIAASLGLILAFLECYAIATYDWSSNKRAHRPEDYVHFHWRMRTFSGLAIAIADCFLALGLYLSSTNRFFIIPVTAAERMETALKTLEQARGRLNALGVLRNAASRDETLRRKTEAYWVREGEVMGQIMDEREVVEGVRSALSGRVQVATVEAEARRYADGLTSWGGQPQTGVGGVEPIL